MRRKNKTPTQYWGLLYQCPPDRHWLLDTFPTRASAQKELDTISGNQPAKLAKLHVEVIE